MKAKLIAITLSIMALAQAPLALAPSAHLSSDQAWELVRQTPLGEKLEVKLKGGSKVKGEMIIASDSELSLSVKNQQTAQLRRGEIREVRRFLPPDPDKQKLCAGIGVGDGRSRPAVVDARRCQAGAGAASAVFGSGSRRPFRNSGRALWTASTRARGMACGIR